MLQDPIINIIWFPSTENEMERLSQGFKGRVQAQDAMDFIHKHEVPSHKTVTYANFVCDYHPLKSEPFRVRMTVGGDKLSYDDDTGSSTASILETRLLANSVISDHKKHNSRFCAIDLKDFFLNTPMEKPEYIRIHKKYFSPSFIQAYELQDKISHDNHIYCRVKKGMYGLKQAAILAYKLLVKRLETNGYYPIPLTNGLFAHRQLPTKFALCVDNFGIKYNSEHDLQHLITTLKKYYDISIDKTGRNYCGLTFEWNYNEEFVEISMPGYVPKALEQFNHPALIRPQYAPHKWSRPNYGQRIQYAQPSDETTRLNIKGQRRIQSYRRKISLLW